MTLLPWLWLHLTKCSNYGSTLHMVERVVLVVSQTIEEFPRIMAEGEVKSCTGGVTTWLAVGSTVSVLQTVEREQGTLKEFVWELRDEGGAHRNSMTQGSRPRTGGCTAARVGWEVTVGVTVHDKMSNLRKKGAGSGQLRHELRARFKAIYAKKALISQNWGERSNLNSKGAIKL